MALQPVAFYEPAFCTINRRVHMRHDSLGLPVFGSFRFVTLLLIISDKGSLPERRLSDASKLASTLYFLVNKSVHVLYTEK